MLYSWQSSLSPTCESLLRTCGGVRGVLCVASWGFYCTGLTRLSHCAAPRFIEAGLVWIWSISRSCSRHYVFLTFSLSFALSLIWTRDRDWITKSTQENDCVLFVFCFFSDMQTRTFHDIKEPNQKSCVLEGMWFSCSGFFSFSKLRKDVVKRKRREHCENCHWLLPKAQSFW